MDNSASLRADPDKINERPASERTTIDFDQPSSLIGQHLEGRFLIEKNLRDSGADEGGIGIVYLARDTKLMGKQVVVKILQESALKSADMLRKFQHEKEALIRIDHPGIVRILDSGTLAEGHPFMVMDYIQGHSLRKLLQTYKQLPLNVVAHLIEAITDALGAVHDEKILHRDVKPENIMLTPKPDGFDRVRLIDFGIARVAESELAPGTEVGRPIGTVLYIAPEQLIGVLDLTPAADIYATGIVAYEMITGQLPFKPKTVAEMYQLEREGVKVRPSEIRAEMPRMAETILLSALEFEAEKRPQNICTFGKFLAAELRKGEADATDEYFASIRTDFYISPTEAIAAQEIADIQTVTRAEIAPLREPREIGDKPRKNWKRFILPGVAALCLFIAAIAYVTWTVLGPVHPQAPATAASAPERTLAYFLTVQKMRDGRPYEAPFRSSGQEIFETGYKFAMAFNADADGYIYVYNEGKSAGGDLDYYLLFPTPSVNGGSSKVTAGQEISTTQNTFSGGKGTEIMWLVWSAEKQEALEGIAAAAVSAGGVIKDQGARDALRDFIESHRGEPRSVAKDSENQRTVVRAGSNVIVHRFELEHR